MNTIISTKPYASMYATYDVDIKSHVKRKNWSVTIAGGAGVAQGKHLHTPNGVATEIDDAGLEILMKIPAFQHDVKAGVMTVIRGKKARSIDVEGFAEKNMETKNVGSRPLTEKDFVESGAKIDDSDGSIDVSGDENIHKESVAKKVVARRRGKSKE